ncbi:MAG TPA: hypothetical protein VIX18_05590, partial [Nitrospirota bacterium]
MNDVKLGFLAVANEDHQEAINIFRRALERKKEAGAFFGFGLAHFHLGDLPTARWAMHKALELKPDHKEAREYLGRIEQEKKQKPAQHRRSMFRIAEDRLEAYDGVAAWRTFFVKGVNIGLGLPGYFPGEHAVK